jgi:hypothetical protein
MIGFILMVPIIGAHSPTTCIKVTNTISALGNLEIKGITLG